MFDRGDFVRRHEVGEQAHHDLTVLEHIGHAGRGPRVVLQHVEFILADPYHIDPGDMGKHAAGRGEAVHFR